MCIKYSVDVLLHCLRDGTDDGMAPAVIRPSISLITDHAVSSCARRSVVLV